MKPIVKELLRFFLQNPTGEFTYREIGRKTNLSIGTVSKCVKELLGEGFVKTRKAAKAIFVKANMDNQLFIQMKKAYNIEVVYSSGLVKYLVQRLVPDAIVLFGSYSKGEDYKDSDIDIAIVDGRESGCELDEFEKKLKRKINLTKIKSLKGASKEFRNTLSNGIVLAGAIEVI